MRDSPFDLAATICVETEVLFPHSIEFMLTSLKNLPNCVMQRWKDYTIYFNGSNNDTGRSLIALVFK